MNMGILSWCCILLVALAGAAGAQRMCSPCAGGAEPVVPQLCRKGRCEGVRPLGSHGPGREGLDKTTGPRSRGRIRRALRAW